ncbi:hypothetical protein LTR56_006985 [Elasticomyces elasticus]|nr:hypothetical protein LTR56_006985 [Elasticomyces elasticus]KAK3664146.1 hypothetical protein LTR22_005111 [Elasticomyces elasticus]KAK4927715.1 hypothetical protein LTR49_005585 [Elasticomyces elasticus]KAK5767086.1 hypothetical protein LTS12_002852 [Elasticomyces elasticus]
MASEVEAFRYPVLEAERCQIRLLTVQRSDLEGDVACHLEVVSLDAIEFTALSYVWGTEQPVFSIQVDGHTLWIRPNLHAYLILAADEQTKGRGIFIDAIRINQNDIAESSSQVALMGRVYGQADEGVVWFGMEEQWTSSLLLKHPSFGDNEVLEACLLGEASWLSAAGARDVQTWVLLPRRLELRVNKLRISGSSFHTAFRGRFLEDAVIQRFGNKPTSRTLSAANNAEDRNSNCSMSFVVSRLLSVENGAERKSIPLYRAVILFAAQDCFVTYDKIFGLLGLSSSDVIPEYSKSPLQIYAQVLVEGLKNIAQGSNLNSNDDPTLAMVNLVTTLNTSLALVLEQPAVMLVTVLAIDRADLNLVDLVCFMNMTLRLRQPGLYRLLGADPEVLLQLSHVEAKSAIRRIDCMRESNSRIVGPDGVAETYAAWEQYIDEADQMIRRKPRQP